MIDSFFRSPYQRWIVDPVLRQNKLIKLSPTLITFMGLTAGLTVPLLLFWHHALFALLALAFSGFCDTLDGSLARKQNLTSDKGAVFDIFSDRVVESSVIIGLYLYDPTRAFLCLLMLLGVLLCVTSFLVVGVFSQNSSEKSFHYSPGLIERGEAFIFFALLILLPSQFTLLAILFSGLMLFTALQRIRQFAKH